MADPEVEYHVVLGCPPWWGDGTAEIMAERMLTETPETVGVYLWRLKDGKIVDQTVLRETSDSDE